jgi:Ser/Thr protein kinase RdoA (MazF antagonist)
VIAPTRLELDLVQARAIVGALEPPLRAQTVRRLAGASNDVFEIEGEGRSVVLKAYAEAPAWKLGKEAFVAGLYAGSGLALTPRWLMTDETCSRLARRFALMTRIAGEPLRARFGQADAERLFREMGELLRQLSVLAMPVFGYLLDGDVAERFETNLEWMAVSFDRKYRDFRAWGGDAGLCEQIERFAGERFEALGECQRPVLCHNDFHPGNVMVDASADGTWRISGVIDFENAVAADPLFDFAKALDYTAHECAAGRAPLQDGYGPLGRPGAAEACLIYRIYHKLELLNWFVAVRADPLGPPVASLIADLAALTETAVVR